MFMLHWADDARALSRSAIRQDDTMPTSRFQTVSSSFHADAEDALFIFRNDRMGLVREPSLANFSAATIPNALVFQNYPRLPEGRFEGAAWRRR